MTNPELIPLNQATLDLLAEAANEEAYETTSKYMRPSSNRFDRQHTSESERLFEEYKKDLIETLQALEGRDSVIVPGDMIRGL